MGETFGKIDPNVANGMTVEQAVREMLVAIYLGKLEYICTHKKWHPAMISLRTVWAWSEDFCSSLDYNWQMSAIDQAE